jgi:hypothetical protein
VWPESLQALASAASDLVPELDGPDVIFLWTGRKNDVIGKAEDVIDLIEEGHDGFDFALDLVRADHDVGIVLGEGPHPEEPVEGARGFVPMDVAEFGVA